MAKFAAGLKPTSLKNITAALKRFAHARGRLGPNLESATPQQVTEALGSLRGTIAPRSSELNVTLVRSYYRWLHEGTLPNALKHAIPNVPASRDHELQVITEDELRALLAACHTHFPEAKRT